MKTAQFNLGTPSFLARSWKQTPKWKQMWSELSSSHCSMVRDFNPFSVSSSQAKRNDCFHFPYQFQPIWMSPQVKYSQEKDPNAVFTCKRMKITTGMLSQRCLQQPGLCQARCLAHLLSKFRNHKLGKTIIILQPLNTKGFHRKWQLFLADVGPYYLQTNTMQKDTLYFLSKGTQTVCRGLELQTTTVSKHNKPS